MSGIRGRAGLRAAATVVLLISALAPCALGQVHSVCTGIQHACALLLNGSLRCVWGRAGARRGGHTGTLGPLLHFSLAACCCWGHGPGAPAPCLGTNSVFEYLVRVGRVDDPALAAWTSVFLFRRCLQNNL